MNSEKTVQCAVRSTRGREQTPDLTFEATGNILCMCGLRVVFGYGSRGQALIAHPVPTCEFFDRDEPLSEYSSRLHIFNLTKGEIKDITRREAAELNQMFSEVLRGQGRVLK